MRRICYRIHLWLGISIGVWFAMAGLSGSVLLFKSELKSAASLDHAGENGGTADYDQLLAVVNSGVTNGQVRYIFPAAAPNRSWEFELRDGRRVYADPWKNLILSVEDSSATVPGLIRRWHTEMFAGRVGARAVGILGIASLALCVTGIVVWWPARFSSIFSQKPSGATRRSGWARLHRALGLAALPLLVLIASTGVTLAWGDWSGRFAQWFSRTGPVPIPVGTAHAELTLSLNELIAIADRIMPQGQTTRIALPTAPNAALIVRKKMENELHPNGMNFIHIDANDGSVLHLRRAEKQPWTVRLLDFRYPLHIGSYGGEWVRFLHLFAGLSPLVLAVSGIVLVLRRVKKRRNHQRDRWTSNAERARS